MNHSLATILLMLPPIALTGLIGSGLWFIRDWRRSWGSHRELPTATIIAVIGFVAIHIGYFLSPVLLWTNQLTFALWLVTPVAILASLGLLWHLLFNSMSFASNAVEIFRRKMLIVSALLATYLLPVIVLMICD